MTSWRDLQLCFHCLFFHYQYSSEVLHSNFTHIFPLLMKRPVVIMTTVLTIRLNRACLNCDTNNVEIMLWFWHWRLSWHSQHPAGSAVCCRCISVAAAHWCIQGWKWWTTGWRWHLWRRCLQERNEQDVLRELLHTPVMIMGISFALTKEISELAEQ